MARTGPYLALIVLFLLLVSPASSQEPLALFDGIWVSVNPPGPQVIFNKVGGGLRQASLPLLGLATVSVSDGKDGSNLKVSGPGFDCYYLFTQIGAGEMTWELKSGSSSCPPSSYLRKVQQSAAPETAPTIPREKVAPTIPVPPLLP
jgi:hypothetical protein